MPKERDRFFLKTSISQCKVSLMRCVLQQCVARGHQEWIVFNAGITTVSLRLCCLNKLSRRWIEHCMFLFNVCFPKLKHNQLIICLHGEILSRWQCVCIKHNPASTSVTLPLFSFPPEWFLFHILLRVLLQGTDNDACVIWDSRYDMQQIHSTFSTWFIHCVMRCTDPPVCWVRLRGLQTAKLGQTIEPSYW